MDRVTSFINDIDIALHSVTLYKFADDTKMLSQVNTLEDSVVFQANIKAIESWSLKYDMPFNYTKCSVMHFGGSNPSFPYYMNGAAVRCSDCEKDLGVYVDKKLNFVQHIDYITAKARRLCGWILRVFTTRDPVMLRKLYICFVRPVLDYASVVWSPCKKAQIDNIEAVQRKFTKRISSLRNVSYIDRLNALSLESLQMRRNNHDILFVCSIITSNVPHMHMLFRLQRDNTNKSVRGHGLCLARHRCNTRVRQEFVTYRVITHWNSLPNRVIDTLVNCRCSDHCRIDSFKNELMIWRTNSL